jgi:hypothetical protein
MIESSLNIVPKVEGEPEPTQPTLVCFVQVKFTDRENSKVYTYRVEPDVEVFVGQYAITRRNMSKVTIIAIDTDPVPNLPLDKYDFVEPVPVDTEAK